MNEINDINIKDILDMYGVEGGRNNMYKCPFHDDKYPSMSIYYNRFNCFACGEKGGSINLIQKFEGLDYRGAVKFLKEKYNIKNDIRFTYKMQEKKRIIRAYKYYTETIINYLLVYLCRKDKLNIQEYNIYKYIDNLITSNKPFDIYYIEEEKYPYAYQVLDIEMFYDKLNIKKPIEFNSQLKPITEILNEAFGFDWGLYTTRLCKTHYDHTN